MTQENNSSYKLLLHNDDFNSMEYVVKTLTENIDGLTQPQAVNAMMETHHNDLGLITTCSFENAKSYCETLCNLGLKVTIEPNN